MRTRPRVLLTGQSGFTGRYVTHELRAAGYDVIGFSDRSEPGDAQSVTADLLDREAVRAAVATARGDAVLHLAAISFVAHGDVEEIYRVNVIGTRNLLEALATARRKPEIVVIASSANVYGDAQVDFIDENTPPRPMNDYAISKLAMEHVARLWSEQVPITITRPFNYTGAGQSEHFLIPKIVSHFRRRAHVIELGNTMVVREFGDVRDVARTYVALLDRKLAGRTFNICSGVGHSIDDVLQMMAEIAGYSIEVRVNQAYVRGNDAERLVGSNAAIRQALGSSSTNTLYDTLTWMYSGGRA